jgi:hypothetical protein
MKEAIENDKAHENSIHPEPNVFWKIRYKLIVIYCYLKSLIMLINYQEL